MSVHSHGPSITQKIDIARDFASDVSAGLSAKKRFLPFRYLYDSAGSKLFEQIMPPTGILSNKDGGFNTCGMLAGDRKTGC